SPGGLLRPRVAGPHVLARGVSLALRSHQLRQPRFLSLLRRDLPILLRIGSDAVLSLTAHLLLKISLMLKLLNFTSFWRRSPISASAATNENPGPNCRPYIEFAPVCDWTIFLNGSKGLHPPGEKPRIGVGMRRWPRTRPATFRYDDLVSLERKSEAIDDCARTGPHSPQAQRAGFPRWPDP